MSSALFHLAGSNLLVGLAETAASAGQAASVPADTGLLVFLCSGLAIVAFFAIWGVVSNRREYRKLARIASERGQGINDLLRTVRMAESIAGIGVWQMECAQEKQIWSDGFKRLFGIEEGDRLIEGDVESLLYARGIDLVAIVKQKKDAMGTYTVRFTIDGFDGSEREIEFTACNLRNAQGEVIRVVAVASEVNGSISLASSPSADQDRNTPSFADPILAWPREVSSHSSTPRLAQDYSPSAQSIDPLENLPDHRTVMRKLDTLVMEARNVGEPLALVVFEVDHFKRIADKQCRETAEIILRQVVKVAQEQAKCGDVIGRLGEGGFVLVCANVTEGQVRIMTERLRQSIAARTGIGGIPAVTVSLGYTSAQPGDSALTMFGRADQALSDAKKSGRNRVRAAA